MLLEYQWPGNIRELTNIIERSVVIAENELIESWYLPTLNISTFISIFLMLIGFYIVLKLESFSKDN